MKLPPESPEKKPSRRPATAGRAPKRSPKAGSTAPKTASPEYLSDAWVAAICIAGAALVVIGYLL